LARMIQLARELYRRGQRCFVVALHSPSVMPGGTPFAKTEAEVAELLNRLDRFMAFFFEELRGEAWTPHAALEHWSASPAWLSAPAAPASSPIA